MRRILTFESWESSRLEETSNFEVTDPISSNSLVPQTVTAGTIETNKQILADLKANSGLSTKVPSLPKVDDKNFLKGVLNVLDTGKGKPVLYIPKVKTPDSPQEAQIKIPGYNISFSLHKDYFGTNVDLPKGIKLNLQYGGSSNLTAGVQIPIGR